MATTLLDQCAKCGARLLHYRRAIGSDICGPCSRWAAGTQTPVDWHYRWLEGELRVVDCVVADTGEG